MPCRATQEGWVIVDSDKMWSTGGENWQTIPVFLLWEPHEQYEKAKIYDTRRWAPQIRKCPVYYREEQRENTNISIKNKETGPKQKWCSVVNVSGGESKVRYYKEQYCIGTWNVRSMNQSKLDVVKQEMARLNVNFLGISEPKWIGKGKFNSDDHYIYYNFQW